MFILRPPLSVYLLLKSKISRSNSMVIERIEGSSQVEFIFSSGKKILLFGLLACMTAAASGCGAPQLQGKFIS